MFAAAPFLTPLLNRVKAIMRRVARPVAERVWLAAPQAAAPVRANAPAEKAIAPMLRSFLDVWISARLRAIAALMRRIEQGDTLEASGCRLLAARRAGRAQVRDDLPTFERLPRGFGWMCGLGPNVQRNGAVFVEWLNEPPTRAIMLAAPERMAALIGPILTATGHARPDWFPVRAKTASIPERNRRRGAGSALALDISDIRGEAHPGAVPGADHDPVPPCDPASDLASETPDIAVPGALPKRERGYLHDRNVVRLRGPVNPKSCRISKNRPRNYRICTGYSLLNRNISGSVTRHA